MLVKMGVEEEETSRLNWKDDLETFFGLEKGSKKRGLRSKLVLEEDDDDGSELKIDDERCHSRDRYLRNEPEISEKVEANDERVLVEWLLKKKEIG